MKKLIISIIITIITIPVFSNPLPGPYVISEVIWSDDGWMLELLFDDMFGGYNNFDELYLTCNGDTSAFTPGLPIVINQPVLITINELINPIDIPIEGGYIQILENNTMEISMGIIYGNYEWSSITPVTIGQSIVQQKFNLYGGSSNEYWLVKESQPSPGEFPFSCQSRTIFSGKVFDNLLQPVPDAQINYVWTNPNSYSPSIPEIITDENGEFYTDEMFSKDYTFRISIENNIQFYTAVQIVPDSINYHEFLLDSFYVSIEEPVIFEPVTTINVSPNPFNNKLEINIKSTQSENDGLHELILFDLSGNILIESAINSPYLSNICIHWDDINANIQKSGIYILALRSNGKIIASQKVIYQK